MRMRAAVLESFGEPLAVQEVELDDPKGHEVLVRLVACGVCHTDLYTASGVDPSGYAPTVLGHEGAGVVEKVGEDVTLVAPGDREGRARLDVRRVRRRPRRPRRYLITGRRIAGSSFGGLKGRKQVPQLVDRWIAGDIDVQPLLSHELTLDEVNRGFELMEARDGIRSVIRFA